jgi:type IV pilus assembly protein PilE
MMFSMGNIVTTPATPPMERPAMKRAASGFTLIEVLIAVAVVGILTAIALPNYTAYVQRARLTEAFSSLATVQVSAEQFWSNNRTYVGLTPLPAATTNFTYALSGATTSAYTVTATGAGPSAGFAYTIDQSGARATTVVPTGWTSSTTCWVDRKSGQCSQ